MAERLFDVGVLAILSLLGSIVVGINIIFFISLLIIFGIIIFFTVLPRVNFNFGQRWNELIKNFFHFFNILRNNPRYLYLLSFVALANWLLIIIGIKGLFLAFQISIPILQIITIEPIVIFIGLIPISIAGIGTRESAMLVLFSKFAPAPTILTVGLIYSFVTQIFTPALCLPLVYSAWKKHI